MIKPNSEKCHMKGSWPTTSDTVRHIQVTTYNIGLSSCLHQ